MNLIEVSITTLILTIGILGCLKLQTYSTQNLNRQASYAADTYAVASEVALWRSLGGKGEKTFKVGRVELTVYN